MGVIQTVSIVGGGSAALFVAALLDSDKFDVTIYEKNNALGRKFLVAGKGGFNLTHSEPIAQMVERYTPPNFLREALTRFDNQDYRNWLDRIGIPTFVGSSRRVYPKGEIKPIEVLQAIIDVIETNGVVVKYKQTWTGWSDTGNLVFEDGAEVDADINIFALGGGSWKVTGSNGAWLNVFDQEATEVALFAASNCAFHVGWEPNFIAKHEGDPLKNIAITCLDKRQKGEVVITQSGLEGNAIYALSPEIRTGLNTESRAEIFIDLKPTLTEAEVLDKISKSSIKNTTERLRDELKLSAAQIGLLKAYTQKETFLDLNLLAESIKNLRIELVGSAPIDEAISTIGGISLSAVNEHFQLKKSSQQYCIGEMLDWDAPTGGYLLQACFSMSAYLANHINSEA